MKNLSIFFSALVALLFSVSETSAQITPPYYNPANVNITGGNINGTVIGGTTAAAGSFTTVSASGNISTSSGRLQIGGSTFPDVFTIAGSATTAGLEIGNSAANKIIAQIYDRNVAAYRTFQINAADYIFSISNTTNALTLSNTLNTSIKPLSVTDTTDSSSTTTGALRTAGGLGVAKKAYFGESVISTSSAGGRVISIQNDTNTNQTQFHANNTNGRYEAGVLTSGHSYAGSITSGAQFHLYANNADIAQITSSGLVVSDGKTLQVGSGSTTSAGLVLGYLGSSGYGAIWGTGYTASSTNHSFATNGTTTGINAATSTVLNVSNTNKLIATAAGITHIGDMIYDKTITAAGTTGAQTINKTTGRVNFAAAATSLVVTNSLATANSIVHCTVATNDATMKSAACVPTAGSFTIYGNAAATAETAVAFTVTN